MKTLVVKKNKMHSTLTMFVFFILVTVPALGTTEFEIGTRFGISHIIPEADGSTTSLTYTRLPSSTLLDISSPTSLYATWFPSQQFGIGPEFSFGRTSVSSEYWGESETESITILYLGGRVLYFLQSHAVSNPYVLGRVSTTIFNAEDAFFDGGNQTLINFGIGLGYQWCIDSAFVMRVEAQYQRLLLPDEEGNANEFSLIFGIGTRFGKRKK